MSPQDDFNDSRALVPTLDRDNWRMWFEQLRLYFIGKDLDYAILKTLEQYASIATPTLDSSSISTPAEETKGFAGLTVDPLNDSTKAKTVLNLDKADTYRAASAKIMFIMNKYIDVLDQELVRPHDSAKGRWEALWGKYSILTPQAKRKDLQLITSFKFGKDKDGKDVDMTIESAWAELVAARGRVVAANPQMTETLSEDNMLDYLMIGLPSQFDVTRQALDSNPNMKAYEKLEELRQVETQFGLSAKAESANVARDLDKKKDRKSKKDHTAKEHSSDKVRCYFCGERHLRQKCELRTHLIDMVSDFQINKAKDEKRRKDERKSDRQFTDASKRKHYKGKDHKGLVADNSSFDESELMPSESTSSEDEDEQEDELCHFTKDKIKTCKIPESDWCGDTGCTTHMTDKSNLFRGPLTRVKRRFIKVGGGRLYADYMGTVEMKVAGVSLLLENVLYVPNLGVNLLSSRKLCSEWKCLGIFNEKSMWFVSDTKQLILPM